MSWAVGEDLPRQRHIGYGVPATCDHPDCRAHINRGLDYACGGGIVGEVDNCGLFFCPDHLQADDTVESIAWVCEQCAQGLAPFDPSPDTPEWARHVLTDDSWGEWRDQYPTWAQRYRDVLAAAEGTNQ